MFKRIFLRKPVLSALSESELLDQYRKSRNTLVILELMERNRSMILVYALKNLRNREDVKDFTNDVFLKLSEELALRPIDNFKGWLKVFLRNMHYDRARREVVRDHYLSSLLPRSDGSFEHRMIRQMDRELLHHAMKGLSPKEQQCLQLIYLEENSYKEVQEKTGWTFNQIRGLRDRAFRKLRSWLTPELSSSS